jgi:hypothetical protein
MRKTCVRLLGVMLLLAGVVLAPAQDEGTVTTLGGAFPGFVDGDNNVSQFRTPSGLALDRGGNLYIADQANNAVRVMRLSSTEVRTLATVNQPYGLAFDNATNLYVTSFGAGTVTKFDRFGNLISVVLGRIAQPTAITSDTNNNLYVAQLGGTVLRFTTNGAVTGTYKVSTGTPELRGIAVLSTGRLVVSDAANHVLWQFTGPGAIPTILAGSVGSRGFTEGATTVSRINGPHQLGVGPNDSIIFADRFNHRVRVVGCDNIVRTLFGIDPAQWETFPDPAIFPGWFDGPVEFAESRDPVGIAVDPDGVVYDTEVYYHLVRQASGFTFPACTTGGGGGTTTNSVPTPIIFPTQGFFPEGVFLTVTASNLTKTFGPDIKLYYTLDATTPGPSSPSIPIVNGRGEIQLPGPVDLGNLRVVAIDGLGNISVVVSGIATGGVNIISLGFESGPASSSFVGTAGQRFVAPVTLTIIPGTTMYGLQFGLRVDAKSASPQIDGNTLDFASLLAEPRRDEPGIFDIIPNAFYSGSATFDLVPTPVNTDSGDFVITIPITTTKPGTFNSLIFRDAAARTLGAGWLELPGKTNLYDTRAQDLIRYSLAHNVLFTEDRGQIVAGAFSFVIPGGATIGQEYAVQVGRASANGNTAGTDPIIVSPGETSGSALRGIRTLRVGINEYIVGDTMPFRWYNAGDFGDGSILNNDIAQMQAAIVYGLNVPPGGSDFQDAYDSCCIGTNGVDYSSQLSIPASSVDAINKIGFGDGILTLADMYVNYWRALDTNLVWYARFWSNGVLNAKVVTNKFRGGTGFNTFSTRQFAAPVDEPNSDPLGVKIEIPGAFVSPGQVLELPVRVKVSGGVPMRSLLFQAHAVTLDGTVAVQTPVQFSPAPELGPPTFAVADAPGVYAGAWIDLARTSVNGEGTLGTIRILVPTNATPQSAWTLKLERVSASPNGIYHFPVELKSAVIAMRDRPVNWADEIPNSWREKYFISPISFDARRDGDPDGDGATNLAEYFAGTNPTDRIDALKVSATVDGAGKVGLSWHSVAGKRYLLESSSEPNGPWQGVGTVRDGNGEDLQAMDNQSGGARFYRVRVAE